MYVFFAKYIYNIYLTLFFNYTLFLRFPQWPLRAHVPTLPWKSKSNQIYVSGLVPIDFLSYLHTTELDSNLVHPKP